MKAQKSITQLNHFVEINNKVQLISTSYGLVL